MDHDQGKSVTLARPLVIDKKVFGLAPRFWFGRVATARLVLNVLAKSGLPGSATPRSALAPIVVVTLGKAGALKAPASNLSAIVAVAVLSRASNAVQFAFS